MSPYKPIPVAEAKRLSTDYAKSMVVILAWDPAHQLTHTTTYGVEAFDKENAAAVGVLCSKAIGSDMSKKQDFEDFHRDYDPALYRESLELLTTIRGRQGCTPQMLQQAERILKAAEECDKDDHA
jgi:hypothetical protein